MKARLHITALLAVLALAALALPALAHDGNGGHTTMNLNCPNPSPNTTSSFADSSCSWTLNPGGDFGNTNSDKVDAFELRLPPGANINTDEDSTAPDGDNDPDDGQAVGQTIVSTDFSADGCGDANDGGTYTTRWEDTWTSYTPPANWVKVAQFNTAVGIFFITVNVPSHVIYHSGTDTFAVVTDTPQDSVCAGAVSSFTMTTYSHENDRNSSEWVGQNPATAGTYDVCLIATEVGGTTHDDCDPVTIS